MFGDLEITDLSDSNNPPVISYTETTAETTTESEALAAVPQKRKEQAIAEVGAVKVGHEGGKKKCGAAKKTNSHEKKPVAAYFSDTGAGKLAVLWSNAIHEQYGDFVRTPTIKELGQLNMFQKKVGVTAKEVMQFAVCNWWKFTHRAASHRGLAIAPQRPVIGFLLANHDIAVNMSSEAVQSIAAITAKEKPKAEEAEPKAIEEKATLKDVLEALGAMEKGA